MTRWLDLFPETLVVCSAAAAAVPAEAERRASELWRKLCDGASGDLFDGPILSVARYDQGRVEVHAAEYRHFMAQRAEPALFDRLRVRPLAVTGLLSCQGRLVFGRRSSWVTQDPGAYELVPSGTVTTERVGPDGRVDVIGQFLDELQEEVGLSADAVADSQLIGLVDDDSEHVVDLVIKAELAGDEAALAAAHARTHVAEYSEIFTVAPSELAATAARWGESLARVTRAILSNHCKAIMERPTRQEL